MSANRSLQATFLNDENGNLVGVVLDGSVYRVQTVGKLLNVAGTQIDPATEGKQDDAITKLTSIDGKDFATQTTLAALNTKAGEIDTVLDTIDGKVATQTTLAAVDTKLGTIDGVLDSIKDTDGIKKITDPLAAGTNRIGAVRIMDESDNIFDSILNNLIRRLESRSSVTSPDGASDADVGTTATANSRLSVSSRLTDGVDWLATVVNNAIRRLETRGSITAPDGAVDADVGTSATSNNRLSVASRLTDGTGWLGTIVNNTIRRLETRSSITSPDGANDASVSTGGKVHTSLYDDVNNVAMAVDDGVALPANTRSLLVSGVDQTGDARRLELVEDTEQSGLYRLAVTGKVSVTIPPPPEGGTSVTISADNPLEISQATSPHLTEWTIPDGKTLHIQQIIAGCQGDPSADGSKVEVYYYNGTVDKLIDRIYVVGQTQFGNYPDTSSSRDDTALVGSGTTNKLRIYRSRLSNSSQEIDAVIRGYTI